MPGQQIWGATRPLTLPFAAGAGPTLLIGRSCRLLAIRANNSAVAAETMTLWDGSNNAGNDRYAALIPATSGIQDSFMDVGIPFENGIVLTESAANISGYLLVAEDEVP